MFEIKRAKIGLKLSLILIVVCYLRFNKLENAIFPPFQFDFQHKINDVEAIQEEKR